MKSTPDQAADRIAALADRLKQAGVAMPIDALERGAQAAAAGAAYDAARRRLPVNVRISRSPTGVRLVAYGRGSRVVASGFRRELLRRLPEVRQAVKSDLLRRLR